MLLSYDLTTFQILVQKLSNFFVGILTKTMTPQGHFEINWPLTGSKVVYDWKLVLVLPNKTIWYRFQGHIFFCPNLNFPPSAKSNCQFSALVSVSGLNQKGGFGRTLVKNTKLAVSKVALLTRCMELEIHCCQIINMYLHLKRYECAIIDVFP